MTTTSENYDFTVVQVPVVPAWQLCPKCNGNGIIYALWEGHGPFSTTCTCDLCNGHKVISIYTGKPPMG